MACGCCFSCTSGISSTFFLAPRSQIRIQPPWLTQRWASWSHSQPQGSAGSSHPLTCVRILGLGWGCSWGTRAPGGVPWGSPWFPILRAAKTSSLTLLCPCSPLSPIPEDVLDEEGCPGSGWGGHGLLGAAGGSLPPWGQHPSTHLLLLPLPTASLPSHPPGFAFIRPAAKPPGPDWRSGRSLRPSVVSWLPQGFLLLPLLVQSLSPGCPSPPMCQTFPLCQQLTPWPFS